MTKFVVAAAVASILVSGSSARADCITIPHTWVLLGLDVHMGAVTMRDTAKDADNVSVCGEGLPVYQTKAACEVAFRHAIQKYAGRSHAEGNYGNYLCTDIRTWHQGRLAEVAVSRQMFAEILSLIARLRARPASA
jgi:hypothetical protein